MKRRIKIFAGCILLFLAGGGIGFLLQVPLQQGGGSQYQESPDKKWMAFASTLEEGSILGPHHTYYEFRIEKQTPAPSPYIIRKMRIDDTAERPIDWREEGNIVWTTNSSAVTFKSDVSETSLEITLKIEP
jgi:hypothetical protein